MAEGGSSSSDWTAGIIAIVAALLIGSAIPIALYFGLYKPKYEARVAAQLKKTELDANMSMAIARQERVVNLEKDADKVADRITKLEKPFAVASADGKHVPEAHARLVTLAGQNKLSPLPDRLEIITTVELPPITFAHGLAASGLRIEAQAYYHDFGRFLSEMERDETFVIIPESLICTGDTTGGSRHMFTMTVYVIQRRDVDSIGR